MLVVKSVPRAVRSKSLFAALSVLLMIAATLFGANVASGDEVWNQSYPRGSQSEECVAQPGETPWQTSWGNRFELETKLGPVGQRGSRWLGV